MHASRPGRRRRGSVARMGAPARSRDVTVAWRHGEHHDEGVVGDSSLPIGLLTAHDARVQVEIEEGR